MNKPSATTNDPKQNKLRQIFVNIYQDFIVYFGTSLDPFQRVDK